MKRRGSSLLMVVLIMSAISIATVTAASVLLVTQRQGANNDLIDTARQMARAGVEEAIYRQTYGAAGGTLYTWGEYGNIGGTILSPSYPLVAEQRYFSSTNCASIPAVAKAATSQNCPYYELAIRDMIAVGDTATSSTWLSDQTAFNNQAFEAQDFPSGASLSFPVFGGSLISLSGTTWLSSVSGNFSYRLCANYNGTGCGLSNPGPNFTITPGPAVKSVNITFAYGSIPSPTQNLLSITNCVAGSGNFCTLGKGYTTADITGYAGNSQVHEIIEFHGATRSIRETAQYYNGQGVRLPN